MERSEMIRLVMGGLILLLVCGTAFGINDPIDHWKFDEGSGQYARDAIGDADAQLGSDTTSSGDTHDPVWSK